MKLKNTGAVRVTVPVLDNEGKPDSVSLQPKATLDLPPGYTLDPRATISPKVLTKTN